MGQEYTKGDPGWPQEIPKTASMGLRRPKGAPHTMGPGFVWPGSVLVDNYLTMMIVKPHVHLMMSVADDR